TLRSLELYSEYEPGTYIERIAPTPLLVVMGDSDVVCPTDLGLEAFGRANEPKRLELYPGGHFSAYTDQFDRAAAAASAWFTEHLRPEGAGEKRSGRGGPHARCRHNAPTIRRRLGR